MRGFRGCFDRKVERVQAVQRSLEYCFQRHGKVVWLTTEVVVEDELLRGHSQ